MTDDIVIGEESWIKIHHDPDDPRSDSSWVKCNLSNGQVMYLSDQSKMQRIKEYCTKHKLKIAKAGLKFRSNEVSIDTEDSDAVYICKSVRGYMGGKTTYCIVLGKLVDGVVKKTAYCIPELLKIYDSEDDPEDCFKEMLIYNEQKKNEA